MVLELRKQEVSLAIHGDSIRVLEFTGSFSELAKFPKQLGFFVGAFDHLNAVIAGVSNEDPVLRIDNHRLRPIEFKRPTPFFSKLADELPVGSVLLNAIELTIFRNEEIALGVLDDIGNPTKFTRPLSIHTADGFVFEQLSILGVEEYSKIVSVCHEDISVAVDSHSGWLPLLDNRRVPESKELTIA